MSTDALPAAAGVGRVALRVADLEETAAFYEETIGLDWLDAATVTDGAQDSDGGRAVLGAADEPLLVLEHAPDASRRGPGEAGLYHLAIRVPDRPTLGGAIERLRDRDLLDGAADHGVSEAVYLRDPEGNGLELYVDRPRDAWPIEDGRVEMVTDPLDLEELAALGGDPPTDAAAPSLPAGTTIGHVHLEVTDLDAAQRCYADALGMGVRQRMGDQAIFLAAGDYHHHVGANTWRRRSSPSAESSLGLAWYEVVVPTAAAQKAAADRLEEAGYDVDRSGAEAVAVTDPDGIRIRLRVDEGIAAPTGE